MDERQQRIETLRAEAATLFTTARTQSARNDQLLTMGGTFLAAAAALGLDKGFREVMLGIPPTLFILLSISIQVATDVSVMSIARKRIEAELADELGSASLIGSSALWKYRGTNYMLGGVVTQAAFGLIAAGAAAGGLHVALGETSLALIGYAVITALAVLATLLSICDYRRVRRKLPEELAGPLAVPA